MSTAILFFCITIEESFVRHVMCVCSHTYVMKSKMKYYASECVIEASRRKRSEAMTVRSYGPEWPLNNTHRIAWALQTLLCYVCALGTKFIEISYVTKRKLDRWHWPMRCKGESLICDSRSNDCFFSIKRSSDVALFISSWFIVSRYVF